MIGRKEEQALLRSLAHSGEAEFVVVYGRRRVGKTWLVRETFEDDFLFGYTGINNVGRAQELAEFTKALRRQGLSLDTEPRTWFDAFDGLRTLVEQANKDKPIVIFLDELPWMDNRKSEFIPAFEHFWNGWASGMKSLTLVTCGSAASWISKKIFRNKGGLYNRVTRSIKLLPFTLAECREYFDSRGIVMNLHDMIESYMIFGGIPYYLKMIEQRYSLALNVDALCFAEAAPLRGEFDTLFSSLFGDSVKYVEVVEALCGKNKGMDREAIAKAVRFGNGGNLTRILHELEECGFIRRYRPYGREKNGSLYQLVDPFTLFHLNFIRQVHSENYWSSFTDNSRHRAWSGYAFEQVCLAHIRQIRQALGILGVLTDVSGWRSRNPDEGGAQVDLVIERNDNVINLCEMKYADSPFVIDKKNDLELRNKVGAFQRETRTRKAVHLTMVTPYGVKHNSYSGVFQSEVTMEDLFK